MAQHSNKTAKQEMPLSMARAKEEGALLTQINLLLIFDTCMQFELNRKHVNNLYHRPIIIGLEYICIYTIANSHIKVTIHPTTGGYETTGLI